MDPRHMILVNGKELLDTTFTTRVSPERTGAMKLELTAALAPLKFHSLVESVQVSDEAQAELRMNPSVDSSELVAHCAERGVHIQVSRENTITIRPAGTFSRSEIYSVGSAISLSLIELGSISSAPETSEKPTSHRLTPHEQDLLANVPPHHGE